jgi:Domain of unknown function (DUF4142)
MRTLRRLAWVAMLTVPPAAGLVGLADSNAATIVGSSGAVAPAPTSATVVRLSRMHHTAAREAELGRLAQLSASRAETRAYGARLAAEFQALDERISALAEGLGIDGVSLARVHAGENTAALAREKVDLERLTAERGDDFDRQFWVVVAQDQLAAADMVAAARTDPQLEPIVVDFGQQLEAASEQALVAARPVSTPPLEAVPSPTVPSTDVPAAPVATPGPSGVGSAGAPGALVPPAR